MDLLWKDIRHTIHSLRMNPGFALTAIVTLALGIGLTTAIFSVVNGVLFRPLPVHEPSELVLVAERLLDDPEVDRNPTSPFNYTEWASQSGRVFSSMGTTFDWERSLTGHGDPALVRAGFVSGTLFATLGVEPLVGRAIAEADAVEGTEGTAVLTHAFWQRRFGGDPKAIGKQIQVDGQPATIIGVMPRDFIVPGSRADLWVPYPIEPEWRGRFLNVIARRAPGVTHEEARAHMNVVASRLAAANPEYNGRWAVNVIPLHESVVGDVRRPLLIVLAAVALLLLIGCVNIANLLLSRATARSKEMAVRAALGATRAQLIRQLLTESVILAAIAGVLGVVIAGWMTILLVRVTPESAMLPRLDSVSIDGGALALTALLTLATGIFFGLAPALEASRADLQTGLSSSTRGSSQDRRGKRFRNILIVSEVALATILLIGAGLLVKSFSKLERVSSGVRAEGVLTMRLVLPEMEEKAQRQAHVEQLLERVRAVPGVERVGAIINMPFTSAGGRQGVTIVGAPPPAPADEPAADMRAIAGDYFRAMGVPILAGRPLDPHRIDPARTEVVVNEAFVKSYFPDGKAVGKRLDFEWFADLNAEIVGVAGSVRAAGLEAPPSTALYLSYLHDNADQLTLAIESSVDPMALQVPVTRTLRAFDPMMPISDVKPLETLVSATIARPRFNATMLSLFAGLGLLLAAMGIYGVLSYSVAQRRQEMGIRMALGADPGSVVRLVVSDGVKLALLGVAVGAAIALASTRVLAALLYGVEPADPAVFGIVAAVLAGVALVASLLPALRATRVDPMIALRPE